MVDKMIPVENAVVSKQDQKMIDFLGKALKSKPKRQMKVKMLLADDSDDDYQFTKPERLPIEKLIE